MAVSSSIFRRCACAENGRRPCATRDRKSTRLNSSHSQISYAVFCLKKKKKKSQLSTDENPQTPTRSRLRKHASTQIVYLSMSMTAVLAVCQWCRLRDVKY